MAQGTIKKPTINAMDYFTTRTHRIISNTTIASHGSTSKTISVALTGYTPIAVVGMTGSSNAGVITFEYYFTENNLLMYFENTTNSSKTVTYIDVIVLYVKSS